MYSWARRNLFVNFIHETIPSFWLTYQISNRANRLSSGVWDYESNVYLTRLNNSKTILFGGYNRDPRGGLSLVCHIHRKLPVYTTLGQRLPRYHREASETSSTKHAVQNIWHMYHSRLFTVCTRSKIGIPSTPLLLNNIVRCPSGNDHLPDRCIKCLLVRAFQQWIRRSRKTHRSKSKLYDLQSVQNTFRIYHQIWLYQTTPEQRTFPKPLSGGQVAIWTSVFLELWLQSQKAKNRMLWDYGNSLYTTSDAVGLTAETRLISDTNSVTSLLYATGMSNSSSST